MAIRHIFSLSIGLLSAIAHSAPIQQVPTTPVKHVVVVMLQDESFDRYFGRYPIAENKPGEVAFHAKADTPKVAGFTKQVMTQNPNLTNPFRLAPAEPTCDLGYGPLAQKASYNHGQNNMFVWLDSEAPSNSINDDGCFPQSVMGYYDGNTVHALWEYAQHYALADHFFASDYSSTASGLINEIAGGTKGVLPKRVPGVDYHDDLIGNNYPLYDDGSSGRGLVHLTRANIGDLLNQHKVSWGAFVGGFAPTSHVSGRAVMASRSLNQQGSIEPDYIPSNEPFQYFKSTSNPHHLPPLSDKTIGLSDQANHQYDLSLFWKAIRNQQLPSVSFVIPKTGQNGHVGSSSPLDEQTFLQTLMSRLQKSPQWANTAVMLVWNNSDGWYDHITPPKAPKGMIGLGYGPRLPFLIVSPLAKHNYVEHKMLDQGSVLRFIEDNWQLGRLGKHTADYYAHSLDDMFAFHQQKTTS
ncbi:alkaline phosphatase family protein [Marinomonas spartinae]|uniref:alkaline phosphatase family protein n=1 Tax=Marinomonas spartinae TaxID=1792290 RepID=UPI0018F1E263|nr:alkaline phosphatase family protein [Marinomonas spartinae]MBJ7553829.1 alkaline phosphatase family protein [Marinomonas spartinae]